jgi:esterase/lipase superfamily enzyme
MPRTRKGRLSNLAAILTGIADRSGGGSVYVIAHNLGNQAPVAALNRPTLREQSPKFKEIVLAAPGIDSDICKSAAAAVRRSADHVTLYASSHDEALLASLQFNGYPRAGDISDRVIVVDGNDTIDASAVGASLLGRSHYRSNKSVLLDIDALFTIGVPALRQPGLWPAWTGTGQYWHRAMSGGLPRIMGCAVCPSR